MHGIAAGTSALAMTVTFSCHCERSVAISGMEHVQLLYFPNAWDCFGAYAPRNDGYAGGLLVIASERSEQPNLPLEHVVRRRRLCAA